MFNGDTVNTIWDEYSSLRSAGALDSAFARLASLGNCVENGTLPTSEAKIVEKRLSSVSISPEESNALQNQVRKKANKVRQIMDGGGKFNYEELVQLVSLCTELDLIVQYLSNKGFEGLPDMNLIYDDYLDIVRDNPVYSRQAQQAAQKNWGAPVRSVFLAGGD